MVLILVSPSQVLASMVKSNKHASKIVFLHNIIRALSRCIYVHVERSFLISRSLFSYFTADLQTSLEERTSVFVCMFVPHIRPSGAPFSQDMNENTDRDNQQKRDKNEGLQCWPHTLSIIVGQKRTGYHRRPRLPKLTLGLERATVLIPIFFLYTSLV